MRAFKCLDVPIVQGSIRDRWFVVVKPAGFVAQTATEHPSVQATLEPFCNGRELSFPIRPEKDTEGLLLVATDEPMRKCLDEFVRKRLVRSTYRVLADVSRFATRTPTAPASGLEFAGCFGLATSCMLGSLWKPGGTRLQSHGSLQSYLANRPLKLRSYHPTDDRSYESFPVKMRAPSSIQVDTKERMSAWSGHRSLCASLEGKEVPPPLINMLSKSLLAHSRSPQSATEVDRFAVTNFKLIGGPIPFPRDPSILTAAYLVQPSTNLPHQIRTHFAETGCPILYDSYYHPRYNTSIRRNVFKGPTSKHADHDLNGMFTRGQHLGMQLCMLELPHPFQTGKALKVSIDSAPEEWEEIHPGLNLQIQAMHTPEVSKC